MNCQDTSENIIDFIDNKLDIQTNEKIENHIATCAKCKAEYNEMKHVLGEIE